MNNIEQKKSLAESKAALHRDNVRLHVDCALRDAEKYFDNLKKMQEVVNSRSDYEFYAAACTIASSCEKFSYKESTKIYQSLRELKQQREVLADLETDAD